MSGTTFIERLVSTCSHFGDKVAMRVVGDPSQDVDFDQFLNAIRSISNALEKAGVEKGDRVAVIGENHPNWAIAYLGTLYRGAVCVPVDPHGESDTLGNFFKDSEAKVVFADAEAAGRVREITDDQEIELTLVEWGDGESEFDEWSGETCPDEPAPVFRKDHNAVLIYTSGTTGKPKGVMLTHGNILAELDAIDGVLEFTDKESVLSLLPLFHAYLQIVNLWLAVTKGASVFYLKELTPEALSEGMIESKMTCLASVPRLWYLFHKKIFDAIDDKSSIAKRMVHGLLWLNGFTRDRFGLNFGRRAFKQVHDSFGGRLNLAVTAGSRFDESVARDFHNLGFTIIQGYGLSETSGAATGTYADDNRVGSVGKPMGDAEVKIDNPDKNGEGEVLIKGSMVFNGYYRNPEATKEAFTDDGWFRSGDLGRFDEDGHLYITGRAKDVIILPSGKNVHPEDLEVQYLKSPYVEEMCVIGVEDASAEHSGAEKLVGVIVPDFEYLREKGISNSKEIIKFDLDNLGRDLPEYQRVRDYVIRKEPLPRTATRKIKRFELRKAFVEKDLNGHEPEALPEIELSEEDKALIDGPAGGLLLKLVRNQRETIENLQPDMNLEIDLRLDSLGRAEIVAGIENAIGKDLPEEDIAKAFTVRDVISMIERNAPDLKSVSNVDFDWKNVVANAPSEMEETKSVLKARPLYNSLAFLILCVFNLFCRMAFRLDIRGREKLKGLEGAYLICPNHQSYIDPFVICSTYPYRVFRDTFHVGASEYFESGLMSFVAKVLKVVPVDPDAQLLKAMRAGAVGLKAGKILNIYPEGERAFDGKLHRFKEGASILSSELNLPIFPVAITGLDYVWGRGSNRIKFGKVSVEFCEPLDPNEFESYSELNGRLREVIESKINEES